jgi:NAD(P)-dependent dehydrogenase (short-subunit alcohol dehydrogenase family)
LLFASRGARVVVADYGVDLDGSGSSSEPAEQVVKEIEAAGGEAVAVSADVSDEKAAASIVQAALDAYGRLDVLVNNAGIAAPLDTIENLTPANYRKMIEVHFLGTVYVTKAAWPHLVEAGYGRVVNTTSEAAIGTVPKNTSYGSAKGAVLSYTRTLAIDGSRHGIHVNAVAPRADTRMATPTSSPTCTTRPKSPSAPRPRTSSPSWCPRPPSTSRTNRAGSTARSSCRAVDR